MMHQRFLELCLHLLKKNENLFSRVEEKIHSGSTHKALEKPPIFIIGPPRSGSTLLYQVLTSYFDLSYFKNLHSKYYFAQQLSSI